MAGEEEVRVEFELVSRLRLPRPRSPSCFLPSFLPRPSHASSMLFRNVHKVFLK